MRISVIIPALNEEGFIGETLEHLVSRESGAPVSDPEIEVIVADGGSTDGTVEISKGFARVVLSRRGRGLQMNAGANVASGDTLLFLHADTNLPKNWEEKIVAAMSNEKVDGGAFSLSINSKRLSHRIIAATANIRSGLMQLPYGDQGIFVRRAIFEKIGGFKEIPIMEDVDLMLRLGRNGRVVLLKDKVRTSARRWEYEGAVYTTIRNWLLITLYFMGVAPERLYKFYKAIR